MAAPMASTTHGGVTSLMSPDTTPTLAPRSLKKESVLSVRWS
uniref:Uncharacterized protein n=1 Tax=Arundo donax TaxID=35708 RepID=A0A0A9H1Q0_ARUDO